MKKILLLTIMLLLTLSNIGFADPSESEILASFKQYVSDEVGTALSTYEVDKYKMRKSSEGRWYKTTSSLNPNYSMDIKKTNSLMSPYMGILEVSQVDSNYSEYLSKEMAETDTILYDSNKTTYKFIIAYQDNKWVITGVNVQKTNIDGIGGIHPGYSFHYDNKSITSINDILRHR